MIKVYMLVIAICNISAIASVSRDDYYELLKKIDFKSVTSDIIKMFTDSKEFWPADYKNYGPMFIRLAWHCAGSYHHSDGRGGCYGARQRFNPNEAAMLTLIWTKQENYYDQLKRNTVLVFRGEIS